MVIGVVLVSPLPPPPGGIATWTTLLLREMKRHADVHVLHVDTAVRWRDVTMLSPVARITGGARQALRDCSAVRKALRESRPSVVHICTSAGPSLLRDLLMVRSALASGAHPIVHYRMGRVPDLARSDRWEGRLFRRVASLASNLVLSGSSEIELLHALPQADVRAFPNMVDVAEIDALLDDEHTSGPCRPSAVPRSAAFVGHVLPSKGVQHLVEACRQTEVRVLSIVGPVEAPFRAELETLWPDPDRLRFHGTLNRAAALRAMAGVDVVALPSYSEGFPNVVLEAMACARPVLASSVGAIPEMLNTSAPDPAGVCVPARDTGALAEALKALLAEPTAMVAMGRRGRARVETEYASSVVTDRLVGVWRAVSGQDQEVA